MERLYLSSPGIPEKLDAHVVLCNGHHNANLRLEAHGKKC